MDVWIDEAARYAEHWAGLAGPARDAIADALELGSGVRVLDIGCGSGDFCALALERGAAVSGLDASPTMIEIAGERAPGADLHLGDMDDLPFVDNAYDALVAINSLPFS